MAANVTKFPSPDEAVVEERVSLAQKVGKFLASQIDDNERLAAEQLAMILAKDAAFAVREALAAEVKNCPHLPMNIAQRISNDVEAVASKFLLEGDGLSDQELETLARECEEQAREILATRENLPEPASFAISELGQEKAVSNLMENNSAIVSERICKKVKDRFDGNPNVLSRLASRVDLPMSVIEGLINMVADDIAEDLVSRYKLGKDMAAYVTGQAKVVAMNRSRENSSEEELRAYFGRLHKEHELGDAVLLGVLQGGGMRQFEIAMSVRAGVSREEVLEYLADGRRADFMDLLDKAEVTKSLEAIMYEAFMAGRVLGGNN